jgi:hypothetical protein
MSPAQGIQADQLVSAMHALLLWWAHVRKQAPSKDPNDRPLSSFFAVLDGMSPKRGPTGVWHEGGRDENGNTYSGHWEEGPLVQGLYDFSSRESAFENWRVLHGMLEPHIPMWTDTSAEHLSTHVPRVLAAVKANERANQYLVRLHNKLVKDKRCPFVLSTGLIGTGPPEMRVDDEIYLLSGVPVPMALRPESTSSTFRVVGAVLVHGLMHAENFKESELGDIILV